jgi:hypothetical protein
MGGKNAKPGDSLDIKDTKNKLGQKIRSLSQTPNINHIMEKGEIGLS